MGRFGKFCVGLMVALPFGVADAWADIPPSANEALTGCIIYHNADLPPIRGGTLVVKEGMVTAMGPDAEVQIPEGVNIVPCNGAAILPGFWNSHVHFTDPRLISVPEGRTDGWYWKEHLDAMFSSYGFVALVDTGSDPRLSLPIRDAAYAKVFFGPDIRTAGAPFVPPNGTPFYVQDIKFPELTDPEQARNSVNAALDQGVDVIKLMTVSLTQEKPLPAMSLEVVKAVTETAHARGKLVLAHPTNREGVELALEGGVDVLLHTAPIGGPWDEALVKRMVEVGMSLVPTLSLWDYEAAKTGDDAMAKHFRDVSAQQVRAFAKAGGRILFGTDAGYMTQYDPTPEYLAMQAAGLSFQQILASLTKNPALTFIPNDVLDTEEVMSWWNGAGGMLQVGIPATFVVVAGDPAEDIRKLAQVRGLFLMGSGGMYARQP